MRKCASSDQRSLQTLPSSDLVNRPGSRLRVIALPCIGIASLAATTFVNAFLVVTLVALMVAFVLGTSSKGASDAYARWLRWQARRRRESCRLRKVCEGGAVREQQYAELRKLVDSCSEQDTARFDLE